MIKLVSPQEFDYNIIKNAKLEVMNRGNNGSLLTQTRKNIHLISAFDIETSCINIYNKQYISPSKYRRLSRSIKDVCEKHSVMYCWAFQIDELYTVFGRTWDDFKYFIKKVVDALGYNKRLIVYVHNLSYEFQFLRGIYNFSEKEVFATDSRRILKCTMFDGSIEFRCSYMLTNMSLSNFTAKMGVEHSKLTGTIDYSLERFSWSDLEQNVVLYQQYDVLGLVEAIKVKLKLNNDNLYTIPLTSTGYVRRDTKKVMRKYKYLIQSIFPEFDTYVLLRAAFRGGDTHANRYYANKTLKNVKSIDISSSYPTQLSMMKFPCSKFFKVQGEITPSQLRELIFVREKAVIFKASFSNLRLKNKYWGLPYLSKDKCNNIVKGKFDNGRILKCEYLETTLTDADFRILLDEYDFDDIYIMECQHAKYSYLPTDLVNLILSYYKQKTELKDVEGQELYYNLFKELINAIYGMCAQDPVIQSLLYKDFEFKPDNSKSSEELLFKYKKNAFIVYQWGVWCTAWARYQLHQMVKIVGENFVYCDTDSVKFIEEYSGQFNPQINSINKELCDRAIEHGAYAQDSNGVYHFMGVFEDDGNYTRFKTLGAKKYLVEYMDKKNKLKVKATIAGVTKSVAADELSGKYDKKEKSFDPFERFKAGFIFKTAGGNDVYYNDLRTPFSIQINGHTQIITSNAAVVPSTYTLSLTTEYSDLLKESEKLLNVLKFHDRIHNVE